MKKLFLLDAYGLIYRAYYALIRAPRVTSKGMNTSAVFGFCNTLDDLLRAEEPDYIAVCFDPPGGKTFRHEAYAEYKAQREKQPEDIAIALPYIKRILEGYRIPMIEMDNYEADDVIGTLAERASHEGFTTYMMTLDKDYGQLVKDNVLMYRPALRGQGFEVRGPKQVCERYGINDPKQVIDVLALEGDTSDNIPGCPGVGEKTAAKLISDWGSVENLIDHIPDLKGAMQKKIAENAEQIRFSKFLVTIKTDVPIDIDLESLRRREPDIDKLMGVFNELEFKSFIAKFNAASTSAAPAPPQMGSLFDGMDEEERPQEEKPALAEGFSEDSFVVANTPAEVDRWAKKAIEAGTVGVSFLAIGEEAMTAKLYGIALAYGEKVNVYVPLPESAFGRQEVMTMLEPLFGNPKVLIISHDVKRDMILLRREEIDFNAQYYDTAVGHYLLKPEMKHGIDFVAYDVIGYRTMTYALTDLQRKKDAQTYTLNSPKQAAERARVVLALMPAIQKALAEQEQTMLMEAIELPLVKVLASMEWEGARVDVSALTKMSIDMTARLEKLEQECYELAGQKFNIGSPSQVGEILFGKMQIDPKAKKTKTGAWSTTEDILEKHRKEYPLVDKILKARALRKLLATYIDTLPALINPTTGKLHTTYNQTNTSTGRISSNNPNLQNIPIRTDDGREIRRAFIPDPGCLLLSADYSQIELRLIADFSGDEGMIEAFNSGKDIHRATAAKIYHKPLDEVTDNERRNAKTANFGIIYGISAFGLSERLEIPRSEAKMLIEGYLATYPKVKEYMDASIERAREQGYVTTIKGRKRYLPDINSRNATVRGYAERNAINAPLQGSAADIIKIAMVKIYDEMQRNAMRSRMILQVHDELIFNVYPDEAAKLEEIVVRQMEQAYQGKVPLEVSAGMGANWLEAH
ncbi:MAG: DNA polymerase I [Bacteroidales bacterium]|nr:DNA polymerase I [Bacteroidales bacterium]